VSNLELTGIAEYNSSMSEKPKKGWRSGPHRPDYKPKVRKGKRTIVIYVTQEQFDRVTMRVEKDGTTKQEIGTALFDNYAKRGLTPG
jgi:hypothetical protein